MLDELTVALGALADDRQITVVVLTGAGRAFSAGVDLNALAGHPLDGGAVGDVLDAPARRAIALLATMPKIVVAKINGFCFTGALELALACDLIVAADEARFGDTHTKFGLRPSWGMSQRLIRLVGIARARELTYTARTFSGIDAAAWGLAVRSVPRDAPRPRGRRPGGRDPREQPVCTRGGQGSLPCRPRPQPGRRSRLRGRDPLHDRRHRRARRGIPLTDVNRVASTPRRLRAASAHPAVAVQEPTAVDAEQLAGDVRGLVRREEQARCPRCRRARRTYRALSRRAPTARGRLVADAGRHLRFDVAGSDRVGRAHRTRRARRRRCA